MEDKIEIPSMYEQLKNSDFEIDQDVLYENHDDIKGEIGFFQGITIIDGTDK